MSDFHPDTKEAVVDTFFFFFFSGSFVQSCCGEGGMLQINKTGVCSQCLSHTGPAPTHGACKPPCPHCSGSRLLHQEPSAAGPGLLAPPRSMPLRFRHLGSPQRHRLGWACILCPSQVRAAQTRKTRHILVFQWWGVWRAQLLRLIASLGLGYLGVQQAHLLRRMLTVQNPKKF